MVGGAYFFENIMKKYENTGKNTLKFSISRMTGVEPLRYEVAPGDVCDIPDGYCRESFFKAKGLLDLKPAKAVKSKVNKPKSAKEE